MAVEGKTCAECVECVGAAGGPLMWAAGGPLMWAAAECVECSGMWRRSFDVGGGDSGMWRRSFDVGGGGGDPLMSVLECVECGGGSLMFARSQSSSVIIFPEVCYFRLID